MHILPIYTAFNTFISGLVQTSLGWFFLVLVWFFLVLKFSRTGYSPGPSKKGKRTRTRLDFKAIELKELALQHWNSNSSALAISHDKTLQSIYNIPNLYPQIFPWLFPYGFGGISSTKLSDKLHKCYLLISTLHSPTHSGRVCRTPVDSGGLWWTLMDSGGLQWTLEEYTSLYAEMPSKIRL